MAKKKYDESEGVWRTIGGRRVFIREGQSLSDAMIESGKFKGQKNKPGMRESYRKEKEKDMDEEVKLKRKSFESSEDGAKAYKEYKEKRDNNKAKYDVKYDSVEDRYNKDKDFRDMLKNEHEKTLKSTRKEIDAYLDLKNRDEEIGDKDDLYKLINENYYSIDRDDFEKIYSEEESKIKTVTQEEYDKMPKDYKGTLKELVDTAEFRGESKEKERQYWESKGYDVDKDKTILEYDKGGTILRPVKIKESDWREQIRKNNEETDRITRELEQKRNTGEYYMNYDKWQNDYYGAFRENERRNAKIKKEVPDEAYEYVEAYAGYSEKMKKHGDYDKWSGKEYTNDEFMEHLTDANWHTERKMLEDAKLTNQELSYIKDKTTLGQWSADLDREKTEKLIDEAKTKFRTSSSKNESDALTSRYSGTIDYLKQTTNMNGNEILELLKRIEQDKK